MDRPKPFIPLAGGRPLFSRTLDRLAALKGAAAPIVIAGPAHAGLIEAALAEAGLSGRIVIEPEARDSGPAMAAVAWIVQQQDPEGVCLFLAADHHIPDAEAFAAVVETARAQAAVEGIVTLGVAPTGPSAAYGYIKPAASSGQGVRRVEAFIEKPDAAKAATLIADGCLWNSGIFVTRAATLLDELARHAPEIARATQGAVLGGRTEGACFVLGEAFREAPKISIDFAVMERTDKCFVAAAEFEWSDLGAWDAILVSADRDESGNSLSGAAFADGSSDCLVQAAPGMTVAVAGVSGLSIIAEPGQVFVWDMAAGGDVKRLVERVQKSVTEAPLTLDAAAHRLGDWLDVAALPLWWSLGADHRRGGFQELLGLNGRPVQTSRRLRVQARQTHVFAQAGQGGWEGPWRQAVDHGLACMDAVYRRRDGLYRTLADAAGAVVDDTALLYDQAFVLLALATVAGASVDPPARETTALCLLETVAASFAHPQGGYREAQARRFQSNPHMHLLEACLAWMAVSEAPAWRETAEGIVRLALSRFIDPDKGCLREFFDADWRPTPGPDGEIVEPGHQFEWAWLLGRWSTLTGDRDAFEAAMRLYAAGSRCVDARRGVAYDEVDPDLRPVRSTARLWVQTERIKAAMLLAALDPARSQSARDDAASAARTLLSYLETPVSGLYRDRMDIAGRFLDEPAPASSLYHIAGAVEAIRRGG